MTLEVIRSRFHLTATQLTQKACPLTTQKQWVFLQEKAWIIPKTFQVLSTKGCLWMALVKAKELITLLIQLRRTLQVKAIWGALKGTSVRLLKTSTTKCLTQDWSRLSCSLTLRWKTQKWTATKITQKDTTTRLNQVLWMSIIELEQMLFHNRTSKMLTASYMQLTSAPLDLTLPDLITFSVEMERKPIFQKGWKYTNLLASNQSSCKHLELLMEVLPIPKWPRVLIWTRT